MNRWRDLAAILAGRWQIPVAICALVGGAVALNHMKPPKRAVAFDAVLADVLRLAEAGAYFDAADVAANLLELKPPLPIEQQATLHDALAEIIYQQESRRGLPNRRNAGLLLEHHHAALACGHRPSTRAALRAGQAYEWFGRGQPAIDAYRSVLEQGPTTEARRMALQGLVRLLDGQSEAAQERYGYIQALLSEESVSPAYLWQTLQYAVQAALDQRDLERARQLLAIHGQRLKRSDLRGYHDYLWAWVHIQEGQTDLAERFLDRVDQWLAEHAVVGADMDRAGYLPALVRWLRGRLDLADARPQAALTHFDEALALQSHGPVLGATTIGRAQALAMLERHEAARQAVRTTLARRGTDVATRSVVLPRLRRAMVELRDSRHEQGDYENAIRYLELAFELATTAEPTVRLDLLEQLAHESELAAAAAERDGARALHRAAGEYYERAANSARSEEPRHAALLWAGATQFDQAGQTADARRLLTQFVKNHALDPRMPRALLQLGQAYAAEGQWDHAISCYERVIEGYPRLEESSRARLQTAHCLRARGSAHYAEAESVLRGLLEDEHIAPQARVFRDALFELCDLLYQQRACARAISCMEDFLAFYPDDPECCRVRFMLADAYRRSAYALRDDESRGPLAGRREAARERFRRAAALLANFEADAAPLEPAERALYERLALFGQGDCLFELNEPQTLEEALALFQQAVARYQNEPAALTAQVQIANVYLRQGKLTEAARAVERARWLLEGIPDQAFSESAGGTDRPSWDRFLSAVRASHLFRPVFADTR